MQSRWTTALTVLVVSANNCVPGLASPQAQPEAAADALEQVLFGRTSSQKPLAERIKTLEINVFGKAGGGDPGARIRALLKIVDPTRAAIAPPPLAPAPYAGPCLSFDVPARPILGQVVRESPEELVRQGMESYARGQLDEACRLFKEALKTDGTNADALYNLGVLAEKRGDLSGALDYYRRASSANPKDKELQATIDEVAAQLAESRAEAARARAEQEFALAASQARRKGGSISHAAFPYTTAAFVERPFSRRPAGSERPLTAGARNPGSGGGRLMRSVAGMALSLGSGYLGGSIGGALHCPMCRIVRGF